SEATSYTATSSVEIVRDPVGQLPMDIVDSDSLLPPAPSVLANRVDSQGFEGYLEAAPEDAELKVTSDDPNRRVNFEVQAGDAETASAAADGLAAALVESYRADTVEALTPIQENLAAQIDE